MSHLTVMESPAAASSVLTGAEDVEGTLQAMSDDVRSVTGEFEGGMRMPIWGPGETALMEICWKFWCAWVRVRRREVVRRDLENIVAGWSVWFGLVDGNGEKELELDWK